MLIDIVFKTYLNGYIGISLLDHKCLYTHFLPYHDKHFSVVKIRSPLLINIKISWLLIYCTIFYSHSEELIVHKFADDFLRIQLGKVVKFHCRGSLMLNSTAFDVIKIY